MECIKLLNKRSSPIEFYYTSLGLFTLMPRKKTEIDGTFIKFIPADRLKDLETLAQSFPYLKDKRICLLKYIEAFSSIVERSWNADKEFVPVSQKILKEKLGMKNGTAKLMNDLVEHNFLVRDRSSFIVGKHSWDYKPVYDKLDIIKIEKKHLQFSTNKMFTSFSIDKLDADCKLYFDVIKKITFDNDIYKFITNSISNTNNNTNDNNISNNNNNNNTTNLNCIYNDNLVPYEGLLSNNNDNLVPLQIISKIPKEHIPIQKIINKDFRISRPHKTSRVYTNITNLAREYRPYLRLNDKPLIGFDIANSQPLIAAIAFRIFSEKEYGFIKDDVREYQKACEEGLFYEYFMKLNGVDTNCEDARTKFKKEFFGKVFYTKEIEKENYLKTQFKEKYPTCYEAIFIIKGAKLYSKEYKEFPMLMTAFETLIMFETNMELIKMGYDVVNIFDSLYSDKEEAIAIAKDLVIKKFNEFGITPKLKDIDSDEPSTKVVDLIQYTEIQIPAKKQTANTYKNEN